METLLPNDQLAVLVIGLLVPLVGYLLNYVGPWIDEKVKGVVQVVVAAVAAGLYQAVEAGGLGLNDVTLQLIVTAILGALAAHKLLWLPSGISTSLGGGRNKTEHAVG
jgi:hypothetical protein